MARLTDDQWDEVRADFEIRGLSLSEISKKHDTAKSTVSERAKKSGWVKKSSEHLIDKKVNAIIDLDDVKKETERFTEQQKAAFDQVVSERVSMLIDIDTANTIRARIYKKTAKKAEAVLDEDSESSLRTAMQLLTIGNTSIAPVHKMIEIQQKQPNSDQDATENSITVEFIDANQA